MSLKEITSLTKHFEKIASFLKAVVRNPSILISVNWSHPCLFWDFITRLFFFYVIKPLVLGFLQFEIIKKITTIS